jgi:hypothetical protein
LSYQLRLLALSLCLAGLARSQSDANKGSISGTIFDPNQAVIPNARVSVTNTGTGLTRDTRSNESGQYRFIALDPGTYQLKAEAPGFAPATADNVVVTVGGAIQANITVALQATSQTVEVSSAFTQVTETNTSQTLDQQAIRDLPINGRRFQDFAVLTPTVQVEGARQQLSFAGQRGINSNVMVDGTDYNEPFFGGIRGGERSNFAFTVPQSAIQEFQAVSSGYAAEYGRSSGGLLNAITRSGSNAYHGEAFYQLRHKELGLKNPLNQQSLETQQQFGGGVGGPVKRDKLFFFAAAEQQFTKYPRLIRFATLDQFIGNVSADIQPAYDFFRSQEGPYRQTNNATAVLGRVDYQFSNGSRLTGRYNHSNNTAENAATNGGQIAPQVNFAISNNGTEKDNTDTAVGQLTSVLSPMVVNDLRVQYSHEGRPRDSNSFTPTVEANVVGRFGAVSFLPNTAYDYRLQFADGLTRQHGSHTMKFGVDYDYLGAGQTFGFNQFGRFTISTSNVRQILQILSRSGAGGNRFDDPSVSYLRQIGNLALDTNMQQLAFFAQDSWRISNSLTMNYGLRWEGQFNPQPASNNDYLVTNVRDFTFPLGRVDPTTIRSQFKQFAPRLGLAWNPKGAGRTVVRAQTGLFYAQTPIIVYAGPLNNFRVPAGDLSLTFDPSTGTGTAYQQLLAGGVDLNKVTLDKLPILTVDQAQKLAGPGRNPYFKGSPTTTAGDSYRNPRAFQASGGASHEVAHGLVLEYQFVHVVTVDLERNFDFNVPRPFIRPGDASLRPFFGLRSGTPRPNSNLGTVLVRETGGHSNYNANTFRAQYRHQRLQFAFSYTLSYNKSDDDNERNATGALYQNPFDMRREYNWSVLDTRHAIGAYAVYQAPLGIELAGLFRYRSALPFDPTTGGDTSELTTGTNRPLEAPGVVFLRNSFRNRDYKAVDLRLLKNFRITEGTRLQFSCEMFNLFNWQNMQFTSNAFIYGLGLQLNGQPAPVDARFQRLRLASGDYDPSTTVQQGMPFQAQLGLRFSF